MIPLIPPTCLRVSTPKTASATASLGSTVNILYLHASPIPSPLHLRLSHLSLFPLLSCRCHYPVLHSSWGNLRCQLLVLPVCVAYACVLFQNGSRTRSSLTVSTDQMRRNRRWVLFGSDLRFAVTSAGMARTPPFGLRSIGTSPHCYLQVATQGLAQEKSIPKPREQKSSNARTVTEKRRVLRQLNRRTGFFDRLEPTTGFCKPKIV